MIPIFNVSFTTETKKTTTPVTSLLGGNFVASTPSTKSAVLNNISPLSLDEKKEIAKITEAVPTSSTQTVLRFQTSLVPNIRVHVANRSLNKIIPTVKSLSPETPDAATVDNIATVLSDLRITKSEPRSFESIPEFIGIDYVGYIIQKDRLDQATGNWIRTDEYRVIGSKANSFKDSRVAYGHQYRYRIKTVIKVTQRVPKKNFSNYDIISDIENFEKEKIKDEIRSRQDLIADIGRITSNGLKNKLSTGKEITTFNILQNLSIQSDENKTEIVKTNSSVDSINYDLSRQAEKIATYGDINSQYDPVKIQENINGIIERYSDYNYEYRSYYYESEPSKNWVYVNIIENVPPPPPSSIKIVPNSENKDVTITWLKPANSQRDIKYFKLYKRNSIKQAWKLVDVFPDNENLYVDKDVNFEKKYIYALTCVDAHYIESFMSVQIQAQLNSNYKFEKKEKLLKWISGSGTKPTEVGIILKKFLDQEDPIVAKRNVVLSPSKNFAETRKDIIIKVTSLDTHEKKEFKICLKNFNLRE